MKIRIDPVAWKKDFTAGVRGSVRSWSRATGTLVIGCSVFLLSIFSANPRYSWQMIQSGIDLWGIAFVTRLSGLLATSGYAGLVLTVLFSMLVGVMMTNTLVQLRMNRLNVGSLGAVPGFLAGGCASCGVGVLPLLGFSGVLASLPFAGNSLRAAGVILLAALITRTGNPETCRIGT